MTTAIAGATGTAGITEPARTGVATAIAEAARTSVTRSTGTAGITESARTSVTRGTGGGLMIGSAGAGMAVMIVRKVEGVVVIHGPAIRSPAGIAGGLGGSGQRQEHHAAGQRKQPGRAERGF